MKRQNAPEAIATFLGILIIIFSVIALKESDLLTDTPRILITVLCVGTSFVYLIYIMIQKLFQCRTTVGVALRFLVAAAVFYTCFKTLKSSHNVEYSLFFASSDAFLYLIVLTVARHWEKLLCFFKKINAYLDETFVSNDDE